MNKIDIHLLGGDVVHVNAGDKTLKKFKRRIKRRRTVTFADANARRTIIVPVHAIEVVEIKENVLDFK